MNLEKVFDKNVSINTDEEETGETIEEENEDYDDEDDYEDSDEDPIVSEARENILRDEAFATGFDAVHYCKNDNSTKDECETLNKRLNLKISTWMEMYDNFDCFDEYNMMRDVSIGIAEKLRKFKIKANEFGSFDEKYKSTCPYNMFLTTICDQPDTCKQPYSVSFHEIIDGSLGELEDSLHINYMVELSWLITEYMIACQNPKMTLIYRNLLDPDNIDTSPFDIELQEFESPEFQCFHSKISILKYKNNKIRIIISTANFYTLDWSTRTQGLWVSPFLPLLPNDADHTDGESPTNFKKDLIEYLNEYKMPQVFGWLSILHRTDFSSVKVFFLGSVPGKHQDTKFDLWGKNKLEKILLEHAILPENSKEWPIVAQSSSVGSFGPNYNSWLVHIVNSMSREKDKRIIFLPELKFIYPSKKNYMGCYDEGLGVCLMYHEESHLKQTWITDYLHQWIADKIQRTFAMPHLKTYTRISPDGTEIPWFVLTSANFAKGGWGRTVIEGHTNKTYLQICNYEAGVVFIPKILIDRDTFPINESIASDVPTFLMPYDVPLTKYKTNDEPYFSSEYQPEPENKEPEEKCNIKT